jgi:hypothetical protein
MSNVDRGAGPIKRKNLQLPSDGDGRWQIADRLIASLILKLSRNGEEFPILP